MGHAHLNIQAIASAARMKRVLQVSAGETNLRKIVPSLDNCLLRDSFISCVNGEVLLDVWLRLCDVESGELELNIKWLDLPSSSTASVTTTAALFQSSLERNVNWKCFCDMLRNKRQIHWLMKADKNSAAT
ncbi:protein C2-DOMAIN ABA-RELATED 11 [Cinnamomum micranthum f. kanehirae]|uniref:Protein C2-DOMAIN ABA-RELATED 11 n=1 Tax=Cinnamomum micranthum f. kanehirae TaxID=337451 RepID=A0A3S3R3T1_9MAGN|nr:protein C2-DOMAIN ABA-RELATED 11 [Cinnamomum micranthum f. kanehirae]